MRFTLLSAIIVFTITSKTYSQTAPFKIYDFHYDNVNSVAFSPDSRLLASASDDGTVNIIDIESDAVRMILKDHDDKVRQVVFSRDGKYIYSTSREKIIVVDAETLEKVSEVSIFSDIELLRQGVGDGMYFSAQIGDESTSIYYFDWKKNAYFSQQSAVGITDFVVTEDGKYMFVAKGKTTSKIDLSTNLVIQELKDQSKVYAIDISGDYDYVLTSTSLSMSNWDMDVKKPVPYSYLRSDKVFMGADGSYFVFIESTNLVFRKSFVIGESKISAVINISDFALSKPEHLVAIINKSSKVTIWENPLVDPGDVSSVEISNNETNTQESETVQPIESGKIYTQSELTEDVLMSMYKSQIEADLALGAELFAPKDEFEKTADYNKRMEKAAQLRKSTIDFYRKKYLADIRYQQRRDSINTARRLVLLEDKIRNSYRKVNFSVESVGSYNADSEIFQVTVNGVSGSVNMPVSEARSFKENYSSAEVIGDEQISKNGVDLEVFNLKITHPITKNQYEFGVQKEPMFITQQTRGEEVAVGPESNINTVTPAATSKSLEEQMIEQMRLRKNYALVIGVEDYLDDEINDLEYPVGDANALANILSEKYTFEKDNVVSLESPTRTDIIRAFDHLTGRVGPKDNLIIFYAGHGIWDDQLEQGYWLPSDANDDSKANWLSNGTIRDYIRGIDSKHTLLIADACFSGGIFRTRGAFNESKAMLELYKLPSRKAMTSGAMKTVPDKSVFMEYLLKRLDENDDEIISASQLFAKFRDAVINNSVASQVPQYGDIREAGDEGGDFIFVLKE